MNGFTKKSVRTLTLGEKLKKLRSEKRMSISEASRFTRIQQAYLECLEEGLWEKLPADVYVKGFLRSYADFLGVDEKILIRLYEREKEIKQNLNRDKKDKPIKSKPINVSPFIFTPKKILILTIVIVVILGLFLLYREINSFANDPNLVIFNPQDNIQITDNSTYVEGLTDRDTFISINGQSIFVGDDGRFKEKITLQAGLNTINVKAVNKFDKETEKSLSIQSNYQEQEIATNQNNTENDSKPDGVKIDLKVEPGPVWINVRADGETVFNGTMLSGALQSFKANSEIIIDSGNGSATIVTFNGKDFGALSAETGAVKGVIFNLETKFNNSVTSTSN